MARKTVSVRQNRDGTWTVKVGRSVEHISTEGKTKSQLHDGVKYAAMTLGVYLNDIEVIEIMEVWK